MKTIIKSLYDAFAIGDIPAVLDGLDDNIIWYEAEGNPYADGNPYKGPDAVLNVVFARIGGDWENFRLVDILLHEIPNNQVLATLRYHGKYIKTGTPIDVQAAHLWTLKNGKVIGFQQYADTKQLYDAMN